jgi:6-phosphogluconolactonase/glucosamine-6-phosphate isomerase/deaminase
MSRNKFRSALVDTILALPESKQKNRYKSNLLTNLNIAEQKELNIHNLHESEIPKLMEEANKRFAEELPDVANGCPRLKPKKISWTA